MPITKSEKNEPSTCQKSLSKNKPSSLEQFFANNLALAGIELDGDKPWDIKINHPKTLERILNSGGPLGLGESYMDGWWDCAALDEFFCRLVKAKLQDKIRPTWPIYLQLIKTKLFNPQSRLGSMKVIDKHYQLDHNLFVNTLDPSLTYSCGYWNNATTLDEAQTAKYDLIAKKIGLMPGMRLLDIGCGWGGFAKHAAEKYGACVTGITLSENQAKHAQEVTKGLSVQIRVQDYRDITETFDRIISIGMMEHVGYKNYRNFMNIVYRSLTDNGLFLLHTIGKDISGNTAGAWMKKYIFPEGVIPSSQQLGHSWEGLFVMEDWHNFGPDYDKTLMAWFHNFDKNWDKLKESYSETFYRMWKYYLLSCAGIFRGRYFQLWQVVLSKGGVPGGYKSVR